jgi:2',3'-cyclic-nucleotide 2'-phosphodiesterase (5'-nucleotidase family)
MKRPDVVGRVLGVSDMHSAYERTAQLLAAFETEVQSHPVPHVIAINGDIFEHGNVVAHRSAGAVDWAFLAALPQIASTVVNLGNHDNDLTPDLAQVVARLKGLGIHVVSTIGDTRTGAGYAEPSIQIPLGARSLRIVGIATDALNTYPKTSRDLLAIPNPAEWARANLTEALAGADRVMIMSHAGVAADRDILPLAPDGALILGGHNHLLFQHRQGRSAYVHTGSWTGAYTVAEFRSDEVVTTASNPVALDAPSSPALAGLIAATMTTHLMPTEKSVVGVGAASLSLGDTGRRIAAGMAQAAGADVGFIGHTTLGAALPAGPITRYMFDAIVRFDGKLMVAAVSQAQLNRFTTRANQDRPMALADRSGDFLYASADISTADQIRIVTTDWCATNQQDYFGTTDLRFEASSAATVKQAAAAALMPA